MCWESIVDWFKNAWSQIYCLIGTISNWLVDCVFQIQNVTMSIFVVIEFLVGAFLFALFLLALWIVGKILRFIWYCTGFMCVAQSVPVPMGLIGSPPQPPVHAQPVNPNPGGHHHHHHHHNHNHHNHNHNHQPHLGNMQPALPIPIPNAPIPNIIHQPPPPRPINPNIPYRHNDRDVLAHDHPSGANRNPGPPLDPANRPMLVPGPRTPSPGWNNENDPLNQTYDSDEEPEPGLQANPEVNPQANPEVEDQGPHPNH
ncbi:uncharacterized histidine-rich protein DDB_G0274557-like [Tigriopus californicus]|uniref:uncharacterized histidine-rich protein DDB_G0274557-like n=1 Tax=Tigriopus californicus TaxID=6832 RepID=UPI0027DA8CA6|nr:uncharacterized histidine-rich protein DDB_G0274557-like [Tigriopus californicus]